MFILKLISRHHLSLTLNLPLPNMCHHSVFLSRFTCPWRQIFILHSPCDITQELKKSCSLGERIFEAPYVISYRRRLFAFLMSPVPSNCVRRWALGYVDIAVGVCVGGDREKNNSPVLVGIHTHSQHSSNSALACNAWHLIEKQSLTSPSYIQKNKHFSDHRDSMHLYASFWSS